MADYHEHNVERSEDRPLELVTLDEIMNELAHRYQSACFVGLNYHENTGSRWSYRMMGPIYLNVASTASLAALAVKGQIDTMESPSEW